jgi:Putative zinc-finger
MNCKQIEKLLPLYAGRDLDTQSERLITAHVESCAACAAAAAEYQQSRELLQGFAPPAVSEDVYAGIRQNVWRQIESESTTRSRWQDMFALFHPRLTTALATVALIAVSAFGIYFIANRLSRPNQTAGNVSFVKPKAPDKEQASGSPDNKASGPAGTSGQTPSPRLADRRATLRRKHRNVVPESQDSLVVAKSVPLQTVYTPMDPGNSGQTDESSDNKTENTLRMEIQTKNPNIRIIWFSQRETRRVSPTSKGI